MPLLRPILKQALCHPKRTAVVDDQKTYDYITLLGGCFHLAKLIRNTTAKQNIGIMLPTSGAFPMALLGTWQAGKTPVPLNYLLANDDLQYVIKDAEIDTVLTVGKLLDHIGGEDAIPPGVNIVKLEEQSFKGIPPLRWPAKPRGDDLAMLLYTSGTSGRPKGVMLTHDNLYSNVLGAKEHARLTSADTFLGVLPQFHAFGVTALTLLPLYMGSKMVYTARFVPRRMVELIKEHRPEIFIAVPSMYSALLSVKNATADDFASLNYVVSGAEPLPQATYDAYRERYNVNLLEGYGLTETSPVSNWSTPFENRTHAVGKPLPNVRIFILDDDNKILGPDHEGEILIAGPNVMRGYWHLPEKTEEVMHYLEVPGEEQPVRAFRTGDIGKQDADGFLFITGRKKEMLIVGGENVFPREIEEVLNQHESVNASAVVGKQDNLRGEAIIAFVELEEGATFDDKALRQHCRDRLPQYKVPKEIRHIETIPRNPTGKILRRELKA
ncbi:MAG: class I adenylate-forming enzyme family protein [Phycisphaerales bacterium JB063]